jgi:anti-sigma regulatory factor (Ser/Thr protein kinase)
LEDISLHILDIAENSIRADAKCITIIVVRDEKSDLLRVEVIDDGKGMDAETLARVQDPFFTTKHKKTGLGIPLLTQAAEQSGGTLVIESGPGAGTKVLATFGLSHMDRPAIGNMTETLITLIAGHADRDYIYEERDEGHIFRFDTQEIKSELEGVPINEPAALAAIRGMLQDEIKLKQ